MKRLINLWFLMGGSIDCFHGFLVFLLICLNNVCYKHSVQVSRLAERC